MPSRPALWFLWRINGNRRWCNNLDSALAEVRVGEVPGRLKLYEEIRRPRVSRFREASRDIAEGLETHEFVRDDISFFSSYDTVSMSSKFCLDI